MSRGKVIDEAAMCRAVNEGLIKGAMLDVIQNEPPTYQEPVFSCPGIQITPHISYISVQSYQELKRRATNNAIMGLDGQISPDCVNY
ncbi:MAG: NAD(P)-dependent oxidoreductase [Enterobacteriaceae bacterium]